MAQEPIVHTLGGGNDQPLRLETDGQVRLLVSGTAPVFEFSAIPFGTAPPDPTPGKARLFCIHSNASFPELIQMYVQFPTGGLQTLAIEPEPL